MEIAIGCAKFILLTQEVIRGIIGAVRNVLRNDGERCLQMSGHMVLDDIAKALGVSKTTVSRAISGTGRVSKATRERVLSYVAQTGFVPNAAANNLATTRTRNIAYSMPLGDQAVASNYFLECLFGVSKVATEAGYHVVVVDDNMDALCHAAASHKVDGLVLSIFNHGDEAMQRLIGYHLPLVLTGQCDVPGVVQIGYDAVEAYAEMTQYVIDEWSMPLGLLLTSEEFQANKSRARGFRTGLQRRGIMEADICANIWTREDIIAALRHFHSRGIRGIICGDDSVCMDLLPILESLKDSTDTALRDMARGSRLASFHSNRFLRSFHPEIPTVDVPPEEMGQTAARMAIRQIERGDSPAYTALPYSFHRG